MDLFYDSVTPANIPAGSKACLYADGLYKAPLSAAKRFSAVRWITVYGGVTAAKYAGCADFETGNPVYANPTALRDWVMGRTSKGMRARVYCNRSDLALVRQRLRGLEYLVWIATLDGNRLSPSYTAGLWAVQFAGGMTAKYDTSCLYGAW